MNIKRRVVPESYSSLSVAHPILKQIYASRGVLHDDHLNHQLQALLPFDKLSGIHDAVLRLERALNTQQRILIVGDFDADGATSCALAVSALKLMGAMYVEFLVPNRFEYGYGLTPGIVGVAKKWKPDLIITVDNGIASFEGTEAAYEAGIDVLITDHHLPADVLPKACAIVNPNKTDDEFQSKCIAGVGVIFYVLAALRRHLINQNWFKHCAKKPPNMAQFLDLVALGTVADVVALDQNNRILVSQGLARIRKGLCRPGIKALIDVSGRECGALYESDLGFAIAPRLNAAGRLDDMSLGIECLLEENEEKASLLAKQLDELNKERRAIETEMKEQAVFALNKLNLEGESKQRRLPQALCLLDESWHQGVIGILASRLKDKYHRPVIAFAKVSDEELKGSARSVSGLNIRDVLAIIDKDNPGLINKFGGHAMAAGLSLLPQQFVSFKEALIAEVARQMDWSQCQGEVWTDGPLNGHDFNLNLATLLKQSGPWGQQFPEPVFDNEFEIIEQRVVGEYHLKLTLQHDEGGELIDAIAFYVDRNQWPNHRARFIHAAYKLDVNHYGGRQRLQLNIIDMKPIQRAWDKHHECENVHT